MTNQEGTSKQIFLTGATGAMGLSITQALIAAGHCVTGVARTKGGAAALTKLGAVPVEVDLFDEAGLREAIRGADVIAHFATSIPSGFSAVQRGSWRVNDRLRREGTAVLLTATEAAGVRRFIFESISLAYPDMGDRWIDETLELGPVSPVMITAAEGERRLADFQERGGEAVNLRFGRLYGPGRASNDLIAAVSARSMPVIGSGDNFVSSIHTHDVGTAVAAAVDVAPGTYNVVDDEPMTQSALMQSVAASLHASPPRRLPYPVARLMLGHIAKVAAVSQRVSNRLFRESTGWRPRYPSAASGWASVAEQSGVGAAPRAA